GESGLFPRDHYVESGLQRAGEPKPLARRRDHLLGSYLGRHWFILIYYESCSRYARSGVVSMVLSRQSVLCHDISCWRILGMAMDSPPSHHTDPDTVLSISCQSRILSSTRRADLSGLFARPVTPAVLGTAGLGRFHLGERLYLSPLYGRPLVGSPTAVGCGNT